MKKILFIVSLLFLITGCGVKEKELDLNKIKNALEEITLDKLDYTNLSKGIEEPLDTVKIYNSEEIMDKLGIDETMYHNIFFSESVEEESTYLLIEPKQDQKEEIEALVTKYWNTKIAETENEEEKLRYQNRLEQSYGENLIYLVGKDTTKKLDQIKEIEQKLFPDILELERADLEKQLGIQIDKIESYAFAVSNKLDQVEQYIIIKYQKESEAEIRKAMHDYFETLEQEWKTKDNANYQLLKNRMEKELDHYLIYLVSKDNEKAYKVIENFYQ